MSFLSKSGLQDSMSEADEGYTSYTQSHRIARLGLDCNLDKAEEELRLSAQACAEVADSSNSGKIDAKYVIDISGQTHRPVAREKFNCMNCGRQIVARSFSSNLEKCMRKGSKACLRVTKSTTASQNQYTKGSPNSPYSPYSNSASRNMLPSGLPGIAGEEYSNGMFQENMEEG